MNRPLPLHPLPPLRRRRARPPEHQKRTTTMIKRKVKKNHLPNSFKLVTVCTSIPFWIVNFCLKFQKQNKRIYFDSYSLSCISLARAIGKTEMTPRVWKVTLRRTSPRAARMTRFVVGMCWRSAPVLYRRSVISLGCMPTSMPGARGFYVSPSVYACWCFLLMLPYVWTLFYYTIADSQSPECTSRH